MTALPRLALLPTPCEEAPRLAAALGIGAVLVKREDLSGTGLGGNKLRQIDVLIEEAVAGGADTVITTAGLQSNFCRALAAGAAKTGLRCVLLLRGEPTSPPAGNLLLDHLFGAQVRFVPVLDPWSTAYVELLEATAAELRQAGRRPAIIHLPGRSALVAARAWAQGVTEMHAQWRDVGMEPRALFVAAGSGLTAAGLALGLKALGHPCRVQVISVQQPADKLRDWTLRVANDVARADGLGVTLEAHDIDVDDNHIGPGYGLASPASLEALTLAARTEGLVLDPGYTGKAMAALITAARAGRFGARDTVAFLHSGGTPGLLADGATVAAHLGVT